MFWKKIFKRKDENKEVTEEKAAVQPDPKSSEPEEPPKPEPPKPEQANGEEATQNFFQRLKAGLSKTRQGFVDRWNSWSQGGSGQELFEDLEELLIQQTVEPTAMN